MSGTFPQGATDGWTIHLSRFRLCMLMTRPLPGIVLCMKPQISLLSESPKILLIENFLSPASCEVSRCTARLRVALSSVTGILHACSEGLCPVQDLMRLAEAHLQDSLVACGRQLRSCNEKSCIDLHSGKGGLNTIFALQAPMCKAEHPAACFCRTVMSRSHVS